MANPELGGVNRTIDDSNAVVNSGSVANRHDPDVSSDTEQYVGIDQASQRPGSKKKACFQITKVSKRNDAENDANNDDADSNDELDESRTGVDEFSSSELIDVNISRNSISELDQAGDDSGNPVAIVPTRLGSVSAEEQPNVNSVTTNANQANGNGPHRFKVVKVATDPIRKGRWTCRDFPSETTKTQSTPEGLRNQDIMSKETHSGNSSAASSVHYVHGQDNNSDNPLTQIDDNGKKVDLNRKISSTSSKDVANLNDDEREDRPDLKEQLKGGLQEPESTEGDDGTSPAGGAIDNKIEQAMDLVKSHLLFAVREEVEVLKEQIKILLEKNEKLQEENSALKQRLQTGGAPPPQQPPHQGMPLQPPTQDPSPYPTMPNQLGQGLGQTPMGQTLSDHAAYPQHQRPTQQTHSAPNPGGLADAKPQYTPQTSVESQGQYHGAHSQRHLPDMPQYSQVAATPAPQQQQPQTAPQAGQQGQASYHAAMASANRSNTTH